MKRRLAKWQKAGFHFKMELLLRTINAIVTGEALFTALQDVNAAQFQQGLEQAEQCVDRLLNVIGSRLGLDHDRALGSRYSFPLMARYLVQRGGSLADAQERDRLLYWYIHTFLWGRYSGMTESTLGHDLAVIEKVSAKDPGDGLDRLIEGLRRERGDLRLSEADFRGSTKGNRFYPLLYMMTRVCRAKDWGTGDELTAFLLGHLASLQLHHVFPRRLLYDHGYKKREVNAIANFTFLTQETNLEVSKREPAEYLPVYEAKHPGAVASHWIPMDPELWKVENYLDFLAERRKLLATAANDFLAKLLAGDVPEPVEERPPTERAVVSVPGAIEGEEEEAQLLDLNVWVIEQGLPEGEFAYELVDEETKEPLAYLDLAWPDGLQEGLSQPVAVLLGEGEQIEAIVSQAGYRFFTSAEKFKDYVQCEILALEAVEA